MSFTAYCPGEALRTAPGDPDGSEENWYLHCSAEWAASGPGDAFFCPGDAHVAIPGTYYEPEDSYFVACTEGWEAGEGEEPPGGLPEGFEPSTAGELFVAGFGIVFAFWALGKVPALIMDLLRR